MFEIISSKTNINFVGHRYKWMAFSAVLVIASAVLFFTKGLNYGIDFKGGAEVQIIFKQQHDVSALRASLEAVGMKDLKIQALGTESKEFLVKMGADEAGLQKIGQDVDRALAASMQPGQYEVARVDVVGPQAGAELRKSGILAMVYALLCIFIYVAMRFDVRYSPGAVIALFHDSVITIGILVITQREFSLQILAAILTIIGYSNNDTIIIFDRVREIMKNFPGRSIEQNVNRAINETLGRTILTSATTAMTTVALMVFGGGVIQDFAFAMTIGIVVGAYSSVFIAAPLYLMISKWQDKLGKNPSGAKGGQPLFASGHHAGKP